MIIVAKPVIKTDSYNHDVTFITTMSQFTIARELLSDLLSAAKIDAGHGVDHADIVVSHARKALVYEDLSDEIKQAILLAALLHDADDGKFFPENTNYENARYILDKTGLSEDMTELVIKMISLVSCSKNGNTEVKPEWLLIPRFADRLEAIGKIGIVRCWQYTKHKNRPVFGPDTPRATTLEELYAIATPERFSQYTGGSASMMDHFYDKLLHLSKMDTTNLYFRQEADRRHKVIVQFALQFGCTGMIDEDQLKKWELELFSYSKSKID